MHSAFVRFRGEAKAVQQYLPKMIYEETREGEPYLIGQLTLLDEEGGYVDSYHIRVVPTASFPFAFPHVYEIGGRIPANIDWHVFPDGHCCLKSIPEEVLRCKGGIGLVDFLENEVKPYFFNQKFRELHGYFLKERAHGIRGNIEFFEELFRTSDRKKIEKGIKFVMQRDEPNRVSRCFCGSGRKYRKCHRETYRLLSKLTNQELEAFNRMIIMSSPELYLKLRPDLNLDSV
jgi:hypothetical protein